MGIFNNREIAIGIWLIIFMAMLVVMNKDKKSLVESLIGILKILAHYKMLLILGLMVVYISLIVYFLNWIGIWDQDQLKDTIIWGLSVAVVNLVRANDISDDPDYFKKAAKDNLNLLVVLEFVINFYTFSLLVELIIVPVGAILGLMLVVVEAEKKHDRVVSLINRLLLILGAGLIFYALFNLLMDFNSFATLQTLTDFSLPPLLTLLYFPFLYVISILFVYETEFMRLRYSIKKPPLRSYAKRRALLSFHVRTELLKRWTRNLWTSDTENKKDIDNSIQEVLILREREKNPIDIPFESGWSPYTAKFFLKTEGIVTRNYHRTRGGSDKWYSDSPYMNIGEGLISNNIVYYVEGHETTATTLRIIMNVNYPEDSKDVKSRFLGVCRLLFINALGHEIPSNLEEQINSETEINIKYKDKSIKLSKELRPGDMFGAYNVNFIIEIDS